MEDGVHPFLSSAVMNVRVYMPIVFQRLKLSLRYRSWAALLKYRAIDKRKKSCPRVIGRLN